MNEDKNELAKVSITICKDENFKEETAFSPNPMFLPVNPESFTQNFKVELTKLQGQGSEKTDKEYTGTKPSELKLDFIFDGTNTIQGYNSKLDKKTANPQGVESDPIPVKEQLKIFMTAVYKMNGDIHRPNFLKIKWGDGINFQGILSNLDLNYSLFKSNGDPLRVKASATFIEYVSNKERTKREKKKSPDLTHVRIVKSGDRLDLMTSNIYKKPKYLTQIARINGLTSFRTIKPGEELIFPPLDKMAL